MEASKHSNNTGEPFNLLLDTAHLLAVCQGSREAALGLIDMSILALQETQVVLEEQFLLLNAAVILHELHKLKGATGIITPHTLYVIVCSLEKEYRLLGDEQRAKQIAALHAHVKQLLVELHQAKALI